MSTQLDIQRVFDAGPQDTDIRCWVEAVLQAEEQPADTELTVRIVDEAEITQLNRQYRHKASPTNVLSFPCDIPVEVELKLLGDIVIAAPVVNSEARQQGKTEEAHWAHMIVHGTLHLLGYDHIQQHQAEAMEARETTILQALGYPDPYQSFNLNPD